MKPIIHYLPVGGSSRSPLRESSRRPAGRGRHASGIDDEKAERMRRERERIGNVKLVSDIFGGQAHLTMPDRGGPQAATRLERVSSRHHSGDRYA